MRLIRDSVSLFVKKITEIGPEGYERDVYGFESENGEVVIPDSETEIGCSAFEGCTALTTATISATVTLIDDFAFSDCPALTDIYFLGTVEQWDAIEKFYYWDESTYNYTVHCTDGSITK